MLKKQLLKIDLNISWQFLVSLAQDMRPILPRYISTSHPYEDYSRLNVYWLSITESVFSTAIIVLISCDAKFVLVTSQRGPEKPRHTDDSSSRLTQQNLTFISRGLHDKVSHFFGSERTSTMFGKSSFIVIVFILLSSTFAKGKPKTSDFTKSLNRSIKHLTSTTGD